MLEDEHGKSHPVDKEALAELFGILSKGMEGVVLNACYSEAQADAISRHIPYVMGMKRAVSDEAAIAFAVGFYDGIGAGKPIEQAFQLGCNAIRLAHLPEHLTPILKKNPDARQPTAKDVETPPEAPDAAAPPSPGAQLIQKAHVEEGSSYQAGRDIIIQQPEKPETLRRKVAVWLGIFAALATMLTFVLTQTSGEDEVPDSAHLFGLVYDENSDPMDRAVIEVRRTEGDTTRIGHFTTQRDGAFDFGVQSKPGSTVWVTVTRNDTLGYANAVTLLGNTIINFEAPDD